MSGRPLPVAILAGGYATRLGSLTSRTPKALLDVNAEPFIAHQLRLLAANGIEEVVVCAFYLGEAIRDFVGDGSQFGLRAKFVFDGPQPMGTAGALLQAAPLMGDAFFVLYGDSYLTCDFRAVQLAFEREARLGLMTVFRNDGQWDRSNVEFDGRAILAYNKHTPTPRMRHIDYGLGVLDRRALETVSPGEPYDLARLYADLLTRGELAAFEVRERFYEIGSVAGLEETRQFLGTLQQGVA